MEQVILVNEKDEVIGECEKMQAHEEGRLHRAFSVLVFNDRGALLLHQRAHEKYHCGGLWTNTCCSHQRMHETHESAAQRRLQEEMGIQTPLEHIGSFIYKAQFDNGLTEHEFDHVLFGRYSLAPQPNPNEVVDWKYMPIREIEEDIQNNPDNYTVWFKKIIHTYSKEIHQYTQQ
jgi:isopentenyl-diphosphate delta-isomerase